jgi:carbamoyltransferase
VSVIVGINAYHAGASAAVLVDGVPVAAIAEERLNRVKYYAGFPSLALAECLNLAGVSAADITHVAIGRDPAANRAKKLQYAMRNPARLLNLLRIQASRSGLNDVRAQVATATGMDADRLKFRQHNVEHHLAHIASSFFASDWDRAAGLSVDGSGDFVTCMLAECSGNSIDIKHRVYVPHSLGSLYMMVCEFIGYERYGDEGKVMGLAPLGRNTYREHFDRMLRLTERGVELNPQFFRPFGSNQGMSIDETGQMVIHRHYSDHMIELFGQPRKPQDELTQREMDMAFGVQYIFEKGYMHLLNVLHGMVPTDRVVLAGGCALNSVANGKLFDETAFRETWIQPAAGDDGIAIGAALQVSRGVLKEKATKTVSYAYLGPSYDEREIEEALKQQGVSYQKMERDELLRHTVDRLEQGDVVGWFQGQMEWGPRALGNRSILAHPGLPNMKDVLNARIKRRESFRPFAPAVLAERQDEIFEHSHPSPFMLHVYKIRPEWRERLTAVNHLDDTGRLQSVEREENPLYYDLIAAFGERTGIPVLLNTSFNENEPIVNTPAEAVDCFARTRMDVLAIGPFFCHKDA